VHHARLVVIGNGKVPEEVNALPQVVHAIVGGQRLRRVCAMLRGPDRKLMGGTMIFHNCVRGRHGEGWIEVQATEVAI
jgi:hypothetical protein